MTIESTTEIALPDNGIEVLPAQRPVRSNAVEQLMLHAQAMSTAKQLADALCDTELVPAIYRGKPGNGAAAILYGSEIGLNPIQSLQNVFVVHGQPAIYARTAVALVKSQAGIRVETVEDTDDLVTVRATDPATGQTETSTWDMKRADRAEYTKNALYKKNPRAMLWAKCAMEVCRRIAPDVLLGIAYSREELELDQPDTVPSKRVPAKPRGVDGLRAALTPAAPDTVIVDAEPAPEPAAEPAAPAAAEPAAPAAVDPDAMTPATRKKWLNRMFALLGEGQCDDRDDQIAVIAALAGRPETPPEHGDGITDNELRTVVGALNAAAKDGTIGQVITDLLNTAALIATGYAEADDADDDGQAALL